MGKYKRRLGARRYRDYDEETLENAIRALGNGRSSRQAETIYKIPRRTLLNKVKNKHSGSVGHPTMLTEVEERCLVDVVIAGEKLFR